MGFVLNTADAVTISLMTDTLIDGLGLSSASKRIETFQNEALQIR